MLADILIIGQPLKRSPDTLLKHPLNILPSLDHSPDLLNSRHTLVLLDSFYNRCELFLFAVSALDDLFDLKLNGDVLVFGDELIDVLPYGCGAVGFVGGDDIDEFLVGFEGVESQQHVYLLLHGHLLFNLVAFLFHHIKIHILHELPLHGQLVVLQRWQHIHPLQLLHQLGNQVPILRTFPYFLANSLNKRRDSLILISECLCEVMGQ